MSAFAVVFERENSSGDTAIVLNNVMQRLTHRGPDGYDQLLSGNVAMGHWHFWTTPEEVGERQPLYSDNPPFVIVLDGRIDNREELFQKLGISHAEGRMLSDAALLLRSYEQWGPDCFKRFIGEFALVLFDKNRNEIICARDPLGDRTLFYLFRGTCLIVASEPWAVAGADTSNIELDESAIAHFFAFKIPEDGRTLFKNVYELLPAHVMTVGAIQVHSECYWKPEPSIRVRFKTDEEYATHFLSLLEESVHCRLRSTTPVGVQMSGGLDSTSVACLAARLLPPGSLTSISYIFDDPVECDERKYIEAVKNAANIKSVRFMGDDLWPLKDWQTWYIDPNQPDSMLYRLLLTGVHSRAKQEGIRVLLTGGFGDHLYQGGRAFWLADLLSEGKIGKAIEQLMMLLYKVGLYQMFRERYIQEAIIKLIRIRKPVRWRRMHANPAWLTSFATGFLLEQEDRSSDSAFKRHASLAALSLLAARTCTHEIPYANLHALEMRHPYRDRRLVEFVLALPAYQLFYNGLPKYILRNAMQGILPEMVRTRYQPTSLLSFYTKAVKSENLVFEACYEKVNAYWRKFLHEGELQKIWQSDVQPDSRSLVPWLCVAFEKWFDNTIKPQNIVFS